MREVQPLTLLTLRFGMGAFLLLLIQLHKNKRFFKDFSYTDWIYILLLAAVGIAGHSIIQIYGLMYSTAINTGWIIAIYPILIAITAYLFLGETITIRNIIGIALGFFGVSLIISKGEFSLSLFRLTSTYGDFLVLISGVTWAAFTVGGRGFLSRFPPLVAITPIMTIGFLILLPFSGLEGGWKNLFHISLSAWIGILYLGIFCSFLAYFFWYSALEKMDSSIIGMYLYLEPFVTLIGAYLFLDEEIQWITLIGGGITLLGVYLTTWKNLDKNSNKNS